MPRVHFVKKARKANKAAGIKKGDSYYWWKFMVGGRGGPKICSKTPPKQSQLTRSEFLGAIYATQESIEDSKFDNVDDAIAALEDAKGEVENQGEECRSKYDNMPDGLQQGDTGQLLETRTEMCENIVSSIDSVISELESLRDNEETDDEPLSVKIEQTLEEIDWSVE